MFSLIAIELQWPEVLHIVKQLANGIKAIISENYVIGDITPDNILVDGVIVISKDVYVLYVCSMFT